MGTIWIKEFTGGLDARRLPETSPGGTLIRARDGHINRGGEFEQRADFVAVHTLPAALTRGMAYTSAGLVVFGHQTAPSLPAGVSYQRLQHPSGEALVGVSSWELYQGKIMAVGRFADGSAYLFHDGTRVTDANAPPNLSGSSSPAVLLTHSEKMHVGAGPVLFFSAVADATDFGAGAGVGDGFIDLSTHSNGSENTTALARYGEYAAVFSRRVVQIWFLDPDPALNRPVQVLRNTGTVAGRSIAEFGDGDVFYLDRSGIRSLRARDSSNSAATTDIGSAIDTIVAAHVAEIGEAGMANAIGLIEPRDGRFWLILNDRIYVFSFFSASRVSAWSEYRPGFTVDEAVVLDDRVWLRSGDTIYVYGGTGEQFTYAGNAPAEAWLPYLDGGTPTRQKHLTGVDAALRGVWEVSLAMDPNDQGAVDTVARLDRTTYGIERIPTQGSATHVGLRFRCLESAGPNTPAVLSAAVIHFNADEEEDS